MHMQENGNAKERRELFRVDFKESVLGSLLLPDSEIEKVKVLNISSMGALIESTTEITEKKEIQLRFSINGLPFNVEGSIIRKVVFPTYNHYGLKFNEDRGHNKELFRELNKYQIQQAKPHLLNEV